jgi:L-lactate dehydrogenase complex protein LldF
MSFEERAEAVLRTPHLAEALGSATRYMRTGWNDRRAELGEEWQAYRERARRTRERTLADLGRFVGELADRMAEAGAKLHFAGDADEARAIVLDVARRAGARSAVKMKSMLTEELRLREHLTANGVATEETDIGEWILQLAHEAPSHLIVPALHKNLDDVKALFDRRMGPHDATDAETLVDRARRELRPRFIEADIGITGVNFAVAETGTLVLVSNEGNGRLTTSAPPIHIALVPVEKIVPTLDEVTTLLELLPRAATGQRITRYISFITGPRREGERDGPGELHVVFVDNGRSKALAGDSAEALLCLRCGACLNACPVFTRVGGQTYGAVYGGPIGMVFTPVIAGMTREAAEVAHASSLCGACGDACPVGIDLPHLILKTRRDAVIARRPPAIERLAVAVLEWLLARPAAYRLALRVARPLAWLATKFPRLAPSPLRRWLHSRAPVRLAAQPFRSRFEARR